MCGMLDNYLETFSQLKTASGQKDWGESTNHMSPSKPLLLLSVLDLIGCGSISRNFIEPSFELTDIFRAYLCSLKIEKISSMAYPFIFLMRDGFWSLRPKSGGALQPGQVFSNMELLAQHYYGAVLDADLYPLLQMGVSREKLRKVLIEKYFSPNIQPLLWDQAIVNNEAVNYSLSLLATVEMHPIYDFIEETSIPDSRVRRQGFRKAMLQVYDHRCALCGLRIIGADNQTGVDAVHIIPWDLSQNDRPSNSLALCKLCDWAFAEGLLSVDNEYRIMVADSVKNGPDQPGHLLALSGKTMFQPAEFKYWPSQENFEWHRKNGFLAVCG